MQKEEKDVHHIRAIWTKCKKKIKKKIRIFNYHNGNTFILCILLN